MCIQFTSYQKSAWLCKSLLGFHKNITISTSSEQLKTGIYQQAMVFIYLFVWFWFLCSNVHKIGLGPSLVLTPQLFFPSRCLDLKRLFLPPRPSVVCRYLCYYVLHINIPNLVNTVEKEPAMLRSAPPVEGRSDPLLRVFLELHLWPQSKTPRSTHDSFFFSCFLEWWVGSS